MKQFTKEQIASAAEEASLWEKTLACGQVEDKVPKGFKTTKQLADKHRLSARTIRDRLAAAGSAIEVRFFRIKNGLRVQSVPHYRVKLRN